MEEPTPAAWHEYLSDALPSYMVPSAVLRVPGIPVNAAGKVDRAALLREAAQQRAGVDNHTGQLRTPPQGDHELRIARILAEHLGRESIAREDRFFDLGGTSLRAIAAINALRRTFRCTINDLYEHPCLADFAAVCRPQPEHLRSVIRSAARHWREYQHDLGAYDAARDAALGAARRAYQVRNKSYRDIAAIGQRNYERVLLTGATGYLGGYLLRELLGDPHRSVSVLVRAADDQAARRRLIDTLSYYFGRNEGAALANHTRLRILAGDLRRERLGLAPRDYDHVADQLQAVFHCAANVRHFGHYQEFHAVNVAATSRLLELAARRPATPADFHLVSTLSVCGSAPEDGFRLFTEYDTAPEMSDGNYYVRSKQEAERLVIRARQELANASIHRVGNLVFASEGGPLQRNIAENAFFRQVAAFLQLGVVPDDAHVWLCPVDVVARGILRLAGSAGLTHEIHHLENSRRETMAAFVTSSGGARACGFDTFLERLDEAVEEPEMDNALTRTMENLRLYSGVPPQPRARRLEIVSMRTNALLAEMGLEWPPIPEAGCAEMLRRAACETLRSTARRQPDE